MRQKNAIKTLKKSIGVALSNIQKIIQREENDKIRAAYGADHLRKFREYVPNISDTFCMPANAGLKPSYQHRDRNTTKPDIVVDRTEKSASSDNQHRTTSSTISFSDPRATSEKQFELHHGTNLPKSVSKCQGNCGRPIKVEGVMVVRSYGRIAWTNKSTGKEKTKFGPMYIHFHENFSETFYAPGQSFDFSKIKIDPKTPRKLTEADKTLLSSLGMK